MESVMWVFSNSEDVDADTKMLLDLRSELGEGLKFADKVITFDCGVPAFKTMCSELRQQILGAKAGGVIEGLEQVSPRKQVVLQVSINMSQYEYKVMVYGIGGIGIRYMMVYGLQRLIKIKH